MTGPETTRPSRGGAGEGLLRAKRLRAGYLAPLRPSPVVITTLPAHRRSVCPVSGDVSRFFMAEFIFKSLLLAR